MCMDGMGGPFSTSLFPLLLFFAGARPDRAAHRHACGLQGREGTPGIDAEKKKRREKRRNLQVEKRGKRGWPLPRASSLFFYKVFFPAPRPAHPPTPTHPPTHPPTA